MQCFTWNIASCLLLPTPPLCDACCYFKFFFLTESTWFSLNPCIDWLVWSSERRNFDWGVDYCVSLMAVLSNEVIFLDYQFDVFKIKNTNRIRDSIQIHFGIPDSTGRYSIRSHFLMVSGRWAWSTRVVDGYTMESRGNSIPASLKRKNLVRKWPERYSQNFFRLRIAKRCLPADCPFP